MRKLTKKGTCALLGLTMLMSLTACGQKEEVKETTVTETEAVEETTAEETTVAETEAETEAEVEDKGKLIVAGTANVISPMEPYLEAMGYDVEIVAFSGISEGAAALADDQVDCVIANNVPWVKTYAEANNADIMTVEPTLFSPLRAMYSTKVDSIEDIPEGGTIVIAADTANQQRDLQHLEYDGLIKLGNTPTTGTAFSVYDIVENPKNLEIMTVDHNTAGNYINDVDAVICGSRIILATGLDFNDYLSEDPYAENYTHGVIVQSEDQDAEWVQDIIEVWRDPAYQDEFNEIWQGTYRLLPLD